MINILAVFTGGGIGAVMRYMITLTASKLLGTQYVYAGTFCANIIGCFIIGYIFVIGVCHSPLIFLCGFNLTYSLCLFVSTP